MLSVNTDSGMHKSWRLPLIWNRDLSHSLRRCVQSSAVSTLRLRFPGHFLRYKIPYGCNLLYEITQTWELLISAVNTILPNLKLTFSGVLIFSPVAAYHTCISDLLIHRLTVVKIIVLWLDCRRNYSRLELIQIPFASFSKTVSETCIIDFLMYCSSR